MFKKQVFVAGTPSLSVFNYWEDGSCLQRVHFPHSYLRLRVEVDVTPESFSKLLVVNVTCKKSHRRNSSIFLSKVQTSASIQAGR